MNIPNKNKAYEKCYTFKQKHWYILNTFGLGDTILSGHLNYYFQKMRDNMFIAKYKELYPKRKTPSIIKALKELPEDIQEEMNAVILRRGKARAEKIVRAYWMSELLMDYLANRIDVSEHGELRTIKTADCGTYRSQGMGMHTYTKKSLEPLLLILQKYGYRVSIEEVYYDKDEEITPWNKWKNISGYRIVGYLDPYQADAVFRMETKDETVEEMVERYEAVGLNTKVIFPMLK